MPNWEWLLVLTAVLLATLCLAGWMRRKHRPYSFAANCFEDWFAKDMPAPLCLIDAKGIIVRVNAKGASSVGLSEKAVIGEPLADFLPDALAPLFLYRLENRNANEPILLVNTTPSGWPNASGVILFPVRNRKGGVGGYIVRLCDIIDGESPTLTREDILRITGMNGSSRSANSRMTNDFTTA